MELSVTSPKNRVLSPPECTSDHDEQEISEEEDDDRNHKHRRRDTRSQSLDRDSSHQVFTKSSRKNNRHFENGNSFNEHEKRHPGAARVQFDSNQNIRPNLTFARDTGPGRGRGRDYGSWALRDSRFNPVDLSSHMVQVGSINPGMFGGRGLSSVSTAQNAPWPAFGMLPGVPTGGLDTLHPIGLQGSLRPPLNSPLSIGIPRQRCRDFEERGFCLRGDICPMEHGVNRIVVDDVQSLSQFNLPVSLPGPPLQAASISVPAHFARSSTYMNSKGANGKNNEGGMAGDGLGYRDGYPGAVGTDIYDPDQPLWNKKAGETSCARSGLNSLGIEETVATLDDDSQDVAENGCGIRNSRSTSQVIWGRICGSNSQGNFEEKADATLTSWGGLDDQVKEVSISSSRQGKRNLVGESVSKFDSSKAFTDATINTRKHTQKAMRTLFVNGVPRESNKRELLLAHFQKFGKVIDIRIPLNSERAFVQFSKCDEAEAALKAPDAVMGNRFIKLWWANRDSIHDNGLGTSNGATVTDRGMVSSGGQTKFPSATILKNNHASTVPKGPVPLIGEAPSSSEQPKPMITSGSKVPPLQKKSEALEQLKEELRKKQEMLEQKRNEFRKQLAKLEKHTTVVKGEEAEELAAKRLKVGTPDDLNAASPSPKSESLTDKSKLAPKSVPNFNQVTETPLQESKNLKQRNYPFAASINTPVVNRYKLDNRTTTIKVAPPIPIGLADVAVLKEHFSAFGEISKVELEEEGPRCDGAKERDTFKENLTACITFAKRSAAEKAFSNAKCWQEHVLQLMWVTRQTSKENNPSVSNNPNKSDKSSSVHSIVKSAESSSVPSVKDTSMDVQTAEESQDTQMQEKNGCGDVASDTKENCGSEKEPTELLEASQTVGTAEEQ